MSEIRQAQQAITEGFICANCRRQFSGVQELLTHFEKCQDKGGGGFTGESSGGDTESGGFKGFLGKAKQKLKFNNEQKLFFDSQGGGSGNNVNSSTSTNYGGGGSNGGGGSGSGFNNDKGSPTTIIATYFNDFESAVEVKGLSRSHFDEFRRIRSGRMERYAAESNKLKIRLSKLVLGLEKFPNLMTKSTAGCKLHGICRR
jgi:hypothetical protein